MKGRLAFMPEPRKIEFREYDLPEPEPGAILVKVIRANVCGSELHIWQGHHPLKRAVLGHEFVGQVLKMGSGVTTDYAGNSLKEGDRVVAPYYLTCMKCRACRRGNFHLCENAYKFWTADPDMWPHFHGAFSTHYYIHPNQYVFKVPDAVPDVVAASANCAITQVYFGIDKINLTAGEKVVIQGAGGLGLNSIAVAKERGATVIVVEGIKLRLDMARKFGADYLIDMNEFDTPEKRTKQVLEITDGWGADVGVEVTGVPAAFSEGVHYLRPGGRYVVMGNVSPELTTSFAPGLVVRKTIQVQGIVRYDPWYLWWTLKFLEANIQKYPFDKLLDDEFTLDNVMEALDKSSNRQVTRATIKC
ncbi:zinc-binding dehydrogenase [Desulfofundulus thermocisternus]|uniref:zinc-binding dehydrogenase n=1 Tax=Desulfofundulus thermocisternus TaxID=42471 RepID=UPI00217ECA66|nr:zinc-binding dehydrogenase [Desulfofundulus thermocisternus]MCS5695922.1 zinc-binding dehydrogenase [Desulfofundulus thermocisternus]